MTSPARAGEGVLVARALAEAGIGAVHADALTRGACARAPAAGLLARSRRVAGVSIGKAAREMHAGLVASVPPERWSGGIVIAPGTPGPVDGGLALHGPHPLPTAGSVHNAEQITAFLASRSLGPDDLVVACVSGGTSAMAYAPVGGLTVEDVRALTADLLRSGADVTSINALRRCLSSVHDGGLVELAGPAGVLGLILTDNVQVGARAVGSGPTFSAECSPCRAAEVVDTWVTDAALAERVRRALAARPARTASGAVNVEVAGPGDALHGMASEARRRNLAPQLLSARLQGEARDVAAELGEAARRTAEGSRRPTALLAAGEVTVTVRGGGRGGRCQELAWAMVPQLELGRPCAFLAMATDGHDFLDEVAGAWVDDGTAAACEEHGIDWAGVLARNDSWSGLSRLGQLVPGRDTGTNVCDLYALVIGSPPESALHAC